MKRYLYIWGLCIVWANVAFAAESITLIAEDDWYPYSAQRDGKPEGMAVDIVRAAYHAAGVDVNLISRPYARCMLEVKLGKNAGCFDTSRDALTEVDYLYPQEPLFFATFGIYARADYEGKATIQTLEAKKVGLTNGYTYGILETNKKIIRDYGPSDESNFRKLIAKRFDFVVVYTRISDVLMLEHKNEFANKIKLVGTTETIPLYISFSKIHPQSKHASELFDEGMRIIKKTHVYEGIEKHWNEKFSGNVNSVQIGEK
jgi:polar amino acid transport system substrate-binding protein